MQRRRVLVADHREGDAQILRKRLVGEGYEVQCASDGEQALQLCEAFKPQLIYVDARLPVVDGPHLIREVRARFKSPPVLLILAGDQSSVEDRVHYMSLDIDDFLSKPFDLDEFVARAEILFREISGLESGSKSHPKGFSGNLAEMNLVDLLQTLEVGKKTGILRLNMDSREGRVYFREGEVIDAETDELEAQAALNRLFTWSEGTFFVELRSTVERNRTLEGPNKDLWTEGMRRLDQWDNLRHHLPPLKTVVKRNESADISQLGEEHRVLWNLLSGPRALIDLLYDSDLEDIVAMKSLGELVRHGALQIAPASAEPANGELRGTTYQLQTNGHNGGNKVLTLISSLFRRAEKERPSLRRLAAGVESRGPIENKANERRRDGHTKERSSIYLSRSELLLIRERLLQE